MKNKNYVKRELNDFTESTLLPHIEFDSDCKAVVEGSKGVIEYSENIVRINCKNVILKFCGYELNITALAADRISITGRITAFEFCN